MPIWTMARAFFGEVTAGNTLLTHYQVRLQNTEAPCRDIVNTPRVLSIEL